MSTSSILAPGVSSNGGTTAKRLSLPGSRAVLGALLITFGAFLTLGITSGFFFDSSVQVVVAARDIAPGTKIQLGDVATVDVQLDQQLRSNTIGSADVVVGTTTTGPIKNGEIIQPGSLVKTDGASSIEMSFAIPAARAVGGKLKPGELVDVLATEKGAFAAHPVITNAKVLAVESTSNASLSTTGDLIVTLGLSERDHATAVVGAVDTGTVTLIRTTGTDK